MPGLVLALSRHRIALSFDADLAPVPAPGHRVAAAGTSGVRCRAQAHRKLPGTPHPGHRLRPAKRKGNVTRTRTKGSARGRGNRTGNTKTDQSGNRIPTIGKEFNPAKARRIARIPRFSVATDTIRTEPSFQSTTQPELFRERTWSSTGRWKYHQYVGLAWEQFVFESDPEELVDLGQSDDHVAVRLDMHRLLLDICGPEESTSAHLKIRRPWSNRWMRCRARTARAGRYPPPQTET